MLASSNQPRDDLRYTTLLALMRVGHKALHVRLQERNKGVGEISEQSLEGGGQRFFFFPPCLKRFLHQHTDSNKSHLEQTEPAWAEFVFALAVFQRKKLNELIDEHRV